MTKWYIFMSACRKHKICTDTAFYTQEVETVSRCPVEVTAIYLWS